MNYPGLVCTLLVTLPSIASAHYHILLPDQAACKVGDELTVRYQFGHPFEHEIFDAAFPRIAQLQLPDGKTVDLKNDLKKIEVAGAEQKKVAAYQLTLKPTQRGDHVLVFASPAITLEGEKLPIFDTVKLVIHVQTQNGWDRAVDPRKEPLADLIPLTRPYGLRAGMLFRAEFRDIDRDTPGSLEQFRGRKPLPIAHAEVEIERFNPAPPKMLPVDEHVTYAARTDAMGLLATTLPDPGWWAVTAVRKSSAAIHRCTFWVHVDGKVPLKPAD